MLVFNPMSEMLVIENFYKQTLVADVKKREFCIRNTFALQTTPYVSTNKKRTNTCKSGGMAEH